MTKGSYLRADSGTTSYRLQKLKKLQSLGLKEKIIISNKIIENSEIIGKTAILYSGGKDSTVLLSLIKKLGIKPLIIYNNTNLGRKEIDDYIRKTTKDTNFIETISGNAVDMWREKGYYPILSKRGHTAYKKKYPNLRVSPVQCCYQLKEKYSNPILLKNEIAVTYWGNRAGDSNRRKFSFCDNGFLFKPKKYKWLQSYPLQHWTDSDILEYLKINVPDYIGLNGFENGCLCCGSDITFKKNNLMSLFEKDYKKWLYYMQNGFAEQILIAKGLHGKINVEEALKKPEILLRV